MIYHTLIWSSNKTVFFSCCSRLQNQKFNYFLNSYTCTKLFSLSFFLPFMSSLRLSRFSLLFGCSSFMFMSLKKVLVLIQTIQCRLLLYIITNCTWDLSAVTIFLLGSCGKTLEAQKNRKVKRTNHDQLGHIHTNHLPLFAYLTSEIFHETYKGSQTLELHINHKYVATNKNKYE